MCPILNEYSEDIFMKTYRELPQNPKNPGFVEFLLCESSGPNGSLKYFPISQKYKLHLNLNDSSYLKHRDAITEFIKKQGAAFGIAGFKYYRHSEAGLNLDPVYYEAENFIAILDYIRNNNLNEARKLMFIFKEHKLATEQLNYFMTYGISQQLYDTHKAACQACMASSKRYIGQTQFTIYLQEPINPDKTTEFCRLLNAELQRLQVKEGGIANTDLPVIGKSHLISFRQSQFDNIAQYVSGTNANTVEQETNAARLKKEALASPLYQTISNALNNLVAAVNIPPIQQIGDMKLFQGASESPKPTAKPPTLNTPTGNSKTPPA